MSNIEKIRQEVDMYIKSFELNGGIYDSYEAGELNAYKNILAFIDSLPEETCKDSLQVHETCKENTDSFTSLEEAAEKCINEALFKWSYDDEDGIEQYVHDAFIAGAELMRKKDVEDMYMSDNRHFIKCYEQGKVDMKVEMMKDAVDYKIVNNLAAYPVIYYEVNHLGLKYGDKVKLIIVKEDDGLHQTKEE